MPNMNPLALMVKAPNIGGIVAQNEAAQAQVNDNALVRQLNLAKVQAAQQQLMKQQQLSDLFKTGKIDPYSEQGIAQIASIDAEAAKPYMDLYSEKLKNTREDKRLDFEGRKTNAQEANYQNLIQTRTANTSSMISDRRASRMLAEMRFDREQTKAALDARKGLTEQNRAALLDYAAAVNAVPEAERAAAVPLIKEQIARVHGADTVDDLPDYDPNTNRVIQAVAAISAPKSGGKSSGSDFKEFEYKAGNYASSMTSANKTLDALDNPSIIEQKLATNIFGKFINDAEAQKVDQAGREFVNAIGRYQSGAVIPESEIENYFRIYVPQAGDTKELLAQKKAARKEAIEAMKVASGGSFDKIRQAQQQPTTPQGGMQQAPQSGGQSLQAGVVEDGYRFKGGNPADANNWEPVQ